MTDRAPTSALALALTLLAVSACGTQEIDSQQAVTAGARPGSDVGTLWVFFTSTDATYAAEQADSNPAWYEVSMDGQLMISDPGDGHLIPFTVSNGGAASLGYFQGGPHEFTIAPHGARPVFEGAGDIEAGGATALFLYGPLDARQGRFMDAPREVPPDTEHVQVINLMRSGQQIEVVTCTDAATCTPLQVPLGEGDLFVADLPPLGFVDATSSLGPSGAGYGYRLVPSASVPNPPVLPLHATWWGPDSIVSFLGGPVYLTDQGVPQEAF